MTAKTNLKQQVLAAINTETIGKFLISRVN
jgi:hypothetical protein